MTRRDYVALAKALHRARPAGNRIANAQARDAYTAWLAATCSVADALMADNDRFDSDRFLTEAGA